jgi:peroxiredoxin Q/BCP
MHKIGDIAPDFELLNQDGKPVKLSDLRGKRVVMFAFPKANTPGCTAQACGFRDNFPRFESGNFVVLGISADTPKDLLSWKKAQRLPYDLLSDPEHKVLEAYGAWAEKSMFGKKYWGITRSHWVIGADGRFEDVQLGVNPAESVKRAVKVLE